MGVIDKNTGELRSTYDILHDLADAWDNLTSVEKQELAETVAGKTQRSLFTAIMTNFDTAVEATEDALNSEGSATEENEKRKKSLQGRVTELDAAWQQFARNTINSEAVKALISLGTQLVKLADTDLGRLILVLGAAKIAMMSFNKVMSTQAVLSLASAIKGQLIGALGTAIISFQVGAVSGSILGGVLNVLSISVKSLGTALLGLLTNPVVLAVAAFAGLAYVVNVANKRAEEAREAASQLADEYKQEAEEAENLLSTYEELSKKKGLSAEENDELASTISELSSKYGISEEALKSEGEERDAAIEKIKEEIKERKKAAALSSEAAINWEKTNYLSGTTEKTAIESRDESELKLRGVTADTYDLTGTMSEITEKMKGYITELQNASELTKDQEDDLEQLTKYYGELSNRLTEYRNGYAQSLENYKEGIVITTKQGNALYQLGEITREEAVQIEHYNKWLEENSDATEEAKNAQYKAFLAYAEASNETKGLVSTLSAATLEQEIFGDSTSETNKELNLISLSMDELNDQIDELQSAYDSLHSAVDEYNSNGYLTIDTLQSLLSLSPEYLANLSMQNGQLQVNNMSLEDQVNALKYNAIAQLEAAKAADLNALAQGNMESISDGAKQAIAGIGNTAIQTGAQVLSSASSFENFADRVLGAVNKLKAAAGQSFLSKWGENVKSSEYKAIENYYNQAEEAIRNLKVDTTKIGTSSGKSKGSGKSGTSSEYKAEVDELYSYNNALEIAKDRVDALTDALGNTDNFEEQEKYIRQLIDALNDQIAKTNDLKNAQTNQINDYINQLRQQGFSIDYNASKNELYINNMQHLADFTGDTAKSIEKIIKKIQELNKDNRSLDSSIRDLTKSTKDYYDQLADLPEEKLKKFQELLKDFQQSQLDQIENQITDLEHAMEQDPRLKALEEQIEALENQNDELDKQQELEEKLLAVEEAKEKLANQRRQKTVQIYREGIGWTWESDVQEIEDAQKDLEDAQKDLNDKIKQDQLDALNVEKEAIQKSYQDKIDALQEFLDEQNYQIDKANRNAIQTFQELQEEMAKFGLDNAEYLSQATNWLNNYNAALASLNNTVNSLMGSTTANGTLYSSSMQDRISTALSSIMPEITSTGLTLSNVDFSKLTGDNSGQTIYIDKIELPNVKDVDDFVEALKDLPRIASSNVTNRT